LDTTVIIDAINARQGRSQLLDGLIAQGILLGCCPINVTEVYMGMRKGEDARTEKFLRSLEFYPVTWEIAKYAGELYNHWRAQGQTLGMADITVAAVAITNKLVLVTDNTKHFPMPELTLYPLP
jgi:predicted nucleic acid-binding protein